MSAVAEFERVLLRNAEPFLEKTKQAVLTALEEAARKHGTGLVTEMRQTLKTAVDAAAGCERSGRLKSAVSTPVSQRQFHNMHDRGMARVR